jgi:hypothetical protein
MPNATSRHSVEEEIVVAEMQARARTGHRRLYSSPQLILLHLHLLLLHPKFHHLAHQSERKRFV